MGLLAPTLSSISSIVAQNYIGATAVATAEIGNLAASKVPSATTIGSAGGLGALNGAPALQYQFKNIVEEDYVHLGHPLCCSRVINTLSGYIKVANAYINLAGTQTERDAIINHMEGGFFYE
jgi:hypothetical protein